MDCPEIEVNDFYAKLFRSGTELYQHKLHTCFDLGQYVRVKYKGEFIALGQVSQYDDKTAVKPVKLFVL